MRDYPFVLPVQLSHLVVSFAPSKLADAGVWDKLPKPFVKKIQEAAASWTAGIEITRKDLDSIDDGTWTKLYELIHPYLDHNSDTPAVDQQGGGG